MSTAEMSATMNAARMLIDARLDAIDRALLGRVSRAERLDVVGEVESRIDELLRERCGPGAEPTREDVLAVLARLDPPEAYLGDEDEGSTPGRSAPSATPARPTSQPIAARSAKGMNLPAILGVGAAACSLGFPLGFVSAIALQAEAVTFFIWGFATLGMLIGGSLAVTLGVVAGPRRTATLVGLISGSAAFGFGLAGALILAYFLSMT